jgi:hypothetical protein
MGTTYEIWCGARLVSIRNTSSSPRQAVIGYLRSLGCEVNEIVRSGRSAVAWQGIIYRAVPIGSEESSPAAVQEWATRASRSGVVSLEAAL